LWEDFWLEEFVFSARLYVRIFSNSASWGDVERSVDQMKCPKTRRRVLGREKYNNGLGGINGGT
jgi:hypothetical protein